MNLRIWNLKFHQLATYDFTNNMLELNDIHASYGKKEILHGISLAVKECEILAIIGPNGAGKSTLLKVAAGLLPPSQGTVALQDRDITALDCPARVRQGVVYFMQGGVVFPGLTVRENLELGQHRHNGKANGVFDDVLQLFPGIQNWLSRRAGLLSGGQRQQVALAMVLLKQPRVLLLDEPSAGLAPNFVRDSMRKVQEINHRFGTTILLVEQNVGEAVKVARRAILLLNGQIDWQTDQPQELQKNGMLDRLFLGKVVME